MLWADNKNQSTYAVEMLKMNTLKTLQLLIILYSVFMFSCSSDDENDIVGSWTLTQAVLDCPASSGISSATIEAQGSCFTVEGETQCFTAVFSDDETVTITFTEDGETFTGVFNYTFLNDTQLDLCFVNDPTDCSRGEFNGDTFSLIATEDECDVRFVFSRG